MVWKSYYFTHFLKDESWKLISVTIDYGNLWKLVKRLKLHKICLNYKIFIDWNLNIYEPRNTVFLKDKIWALIFLYLISLTIFGR